MDEEDAETVNKAMAEITALLEDAHELAIAGQSSKTPKPALIMLAKRIREQGEEIVKRAAAVQQLFKQSG